MNRRRFLTTAVLMGTGAVAGCSGTSNSPTDTARSATATAQSETATAEGTTATPPPESATGSPTQTADNASQRYFFRDESGTLGHLGDTAIPDGVAEARIITNTVEEQAWQEKRTNDTLYVEHAVEEGLLPKTEGLDLTVEEMIQRTAEIYRHPAANLRVPDHLGIDLQAEDDEITFTRALVRTAEEAGIHTSAYADVVVPSLAEAAVRAIQPGFENYTLSTIRATEPIDPDFSVSVTAVRENEWGQEFGNPGLAHLTGILQYETDGDQKVKYAEFTDPVSVGIFRGVIRDPERSLYRASLDQDTVNKSPTSEPGDPGHMFPEHYVTALDYSKARRLEAAGIILEGRNGAGNINGIGDYIGGVLLQLIDDMGITGYDVNPDRDLPRAETAMDATLVSDSFGESLEAYTADPTSEQRQYVENIGRGLFRLYQQVGWETATAITGTIAAPEIYPTDQDTINQIRQEQAYDEVHQRVT